jgi:hypothetical protein
MMHALHQAYISFQIPVKMGFKRVFQTTPLFSGSIDRVFCNFETGMSRVLKSPRLVIALILLQWLCAVEREGLFALTEEEKTMYKVPSDLVCEADPDVPEQSISARFMPTNLSDFPCERIRTL